MNATNTITTSQFNHLAPDVLVFRGKKYSRTQGLFDDATDTVHFDYTAARRQRGAVLKSKVRVTSSYDVGLDLYHLTITYFCGLSFDDDILFDSGGVYAESFGNIAEFIARAADSIV
jgi:hypothetical protein